MGSLQDDTQSPVTDCQRHDGETDDGQRLGGADAPAGPQLSPTDASQRLTSQEHRQPEVVKVTVEEEEEEGEKEEEQEAEHSEAASEDPALSVDSVVVAVVVDVSADDPASTTHVVTNDCPQTETIALEVAPDADPPSADGPSTENKMTMSTRSATSSSSCDPTDGETGNESQGGPCVDKAAFAVDHATGEEKPEGGGGEGGVEIPASPVQDPPVPRSPAPPGQQHMRTQVSLEAPQCHSVACSPMTPPGGDHTFVFPVGLQTQGGDMRTGHRVECRSVATAPMTPKTPIASTFPDVVKGESGSEERVVRLSNGDPQRGRTDHGQQDLRSGDTGVSKASESASAMGDVSVDQPIKSNALPELPSTQLVSSIQVTVEDHQTPCRPQTQRFGSMDQDITILVTQHDSMTESPDEEKEEEAEASTSAAAGLKRVKVEEEGDHHQGSRVDREAVEAGEGAGQERTEGQTVSTGSCHTKVKSDTECAPNKSTPDFQWSKMQIEGPSIILRDKDHPVHNKKSESIIGGINEEACLKENLVKEPTEEASSLRKPLVPGSKAPSECHHMYTQVSLEVVQCHFAATSPMTPPDGDNAFTFPHSCSRAPAAVPQVEYCSIATSPMTPTPPVGFPTVGIEERKEEEIPEPGKGKGEGNAMATVADVHKKGDSPEENGAVMEERVDGMMGGEGNAENNCKEAGGEKSEEPVQEVSWDEKGMTWEVYGAVVEVAVLGSAIQKHLEKQVKKQKQPSLPPPPPLSPTAVPLPCPPPITTTNTTDPTQASSGKGRAGKRGGKEGRRRRNPFRLLLQNMQQPRCCTRAHSAE
ncbi:hypothetical protein CRUP_031539 [Coryphaenoides rupestris]|nr:hypothetical protein CRUP_031539 [Coryphaenoides rupestris]